LQCNSSSETVIQSATTTTSASSSSSRAIVTPSVVTERSPRKHQGSSVSAQPLPRLGLSIARLGHAVNPFAQSCEDIDDQQRRSACQVTYAPKQRTTEETARVRGQRSDLLQR
jgi:hypothetical protein